MKTSCYSLLAFALCFILTDVSSAQVVPYRVSGTVTGDLSTGIASGEAVGLHFGNLTFDISQGATFDVQTAADGSELYLVLVQDLVFEMTPYGDDGLVTLFAVQEWMIIGGSGRFENASAAEGNIISTLSTEPFDPLNPVITGPFQKIGKINLGRKGKK